MDFPLNITKFGSLDMAFIIPVVRKDFQLYRTEEPRKLAKPKISPQPQVIAPTHPSGSKDLSLDRQKRLQEIRDKRQAKLYNRKRQNTVLRKISEINEEQELTDEELVFNEIENGFTHLRKLSEVEEDSGHESESRSDSCDSSDGAEVTSNKKKHHRIANLMRWLSKGNKKKEPKPRP